MSEFVATVEGEPCGFPELVAAASRDLEGISDGDVGGFLGRAGRPRVVLGVRGVGVCTGFQPPASSHTGLMVEADAGAQAAGTCDVERSGGDEDGGADR